MTQPDDWSFRTHGRAEAYDAWSRMLSTTHLPWSITELVQDPQTGFGASVRRRHLADLVLVVSLALALATREGRGGDHWTTAVKGALQGIGRNPLIWAILAGLAASAADLELPFAIDEFLRLLATAAGPVALFAIGLSLYRPGRMRIEAITWIIVAIKLLLHPALAWLVATWVLRLTAVETGVLVLMAALPAAGTVFLFAERQGADADRIAAIIMLSTVLAFATFSFVGSLLR